MGPTAPHSQHSPVLSSPRDITTPRPSSPVDPPHRDPLAARVALLLVGPHVINPEQPLLPRHALGAVARLAPSRAVRPSPRARVAVARLARVARGVRLSGVVARVVGLAAEGQRHQRKTEHHGAPTVLLARMACWQRVSSA